MLYIRVYVVDLQGNGSQAWEPVKASVLSKEYVVKRTRGGQINTFQLPAIDIYLHHGVDVSLWTGELCWVFHLWQWLYWESSFHIEDVTFIRTMNQR